MPLTHAQVARLLTPVRADRIKQVSGNSYVAAHEVKAELTRVFGPGNWDHTIHDVRLLYEDTEFHTNKQGEVIKGKDGNPLTYYKVCYSAACTLRVRDYDGHPIYETTEYHAEECAPQPSRGEAYANALTSAESYALRRAALDLGDAFGLHLYDDGRISPLVRGTLLTTDKDSPMYSPPEPPNEEQLASLQHSLGATVIGEEVSA